MDGSQDAAASAATLPSTTSQASASSSASTLYSPATTVYRLTDLLPGEPDVSTASTGTDTGNTTTSGSALLLPCVPVTPALGNRRAETGTGTGSDLCVDASLPPLPLSSSTDSLDSLMSTGTVSSTAPAVSTSTTSHTSSGTATQAASTGSSVATLAVASEPVPREDTSQAAGATAVGAPS